MNLDQYSCYNVPRFEEVFEWIIHCFGMHPLLSVLSNWATYSGTSPALRLFNLYGKETECRTYSDLYSISINVSNYLFHELHLRKGDRIILCFTPGIQFIQAFLGCLFLGIISIPAYPPDLNKPEDVNRFKNIIDISEPKYILTHTHYLQLVRYCRGHRYTNHNGKITFSFSKQLFWVPFEIIKQFQHKHHLSTNINTSLMRVSQENSSHKTILQSIGNEHTRSFPSVHEHISSRIPSTQYSQEEWMPSFTNLSEIIMIQFTSGSTREPQGIAISYGALIFNLHACMCAMRGQSSYSANNFIPSFNPQHQSLYTFFSYVKKRQEATRLLNGHHMRFITWLPLYHDMGLIGTLLSGLFAGEEILMLSPLDFIKNPSIWFELISKYECTGTACPNFGLDLVVRKIPKNIFDKLNLSSTIESGFLCGAEPIRAVTLMRFLQKFQSVGIAPEYINPAYGLAENTLIVTANSYKGDWIEPVIIEFNPATVIQGHPIHLTGGPYTLTELMNQHKILTKEEIVLKHYCVGCGIPAEKTIIIIVHPDTHVELPWGYLGEIWVSSPSGASGIWNRPVATQNQLFASCKLFTGNLASEQYSMSSPSFIRTGDLGILLNFTEGQIQESFNTNSRPELFLIGRLKDTVVIRGKKYQARDIEAIIEDTYPSVIRSGRVAAFSLDDHEKQHYLTEMLHTTGTNDCLSSIIIAAEIRSEALYDFFGLKERKFSSFNLCTGYPKTANYTKKEKKRHFMHQKLFQSSNQKELLELNELFAIDVKQTVRKALGLKSEIILTTPHQLPITSSGKIRRYAVKEQFLNQKLNILSLHIKRKINTSHKDTISDRSLSPEITDLNKNACIESTPMPSNNVDSVISQSDIMCSNKENLITPSSDINGILYQLFYDYLLSSGDPDMTNMLDFLKNGTFQDLDLDSLTAVEIIQKINEHFQIDLPITVLFDHPTISQLNDYIHKVMLTSEDQSNPVLRTSVFNNIHKDILPSEQFAIISAACRLPANSSSSVTCHRDLKSFWDLLLVPGKDSIIQLLSHTPTTHKEPNPTSSVSYGAYLPENDFKSDLSQIQLKEFKMSSIEYNALDPHQSLMLMVTKEALSLAGYHSNSTSHRLGLFVGCCSGWANQMGYSNDQYQADSLKQKTFEPFNHPSLSALKLSSLAPSLIANRVSYSLELEGPSVVIDTSCSSSLVALDIGLQQLKKKPFTFPLEGVIIGGINLILSEHITYALAKIGALAPDGRCKTFDASADGYVRGEGCVALVIIPWFTEDNTNRQPPLALIKGSGINHNGQSVGLTIPNGSSQSRLISSCLHQAQLSPNDISYIECHGTGTRIGDPIEVNAILNVFRDTSTRQQNLLLHLGSVKTNLGHLEGAAGIVGLLKLILTLGFRYIPPVVNYKTINPLIQSSTVPYHIRSNEDAPSYITEKNIFGSINSFGVGGTNSHVIIEGFKQFNSSCYLNNTKHSIQNENSGYEHIVPPSMRESMSFPLGSYEWSTHIRKFRDIVSLQLPDRPYQYPQKDGRFRQFFIRSTTTASQMDCSVISNTVTNNVGTTSEDISNIIQQIVLSIIPESDRYLSFDVPFNYLGVDSLGAIEIAEKLSSQFNRLFPSTLIFNFPTINKLTSYIIDNNTSINLKSSVSPVLMNTQSMHTRIAIISMACKFPGDCDSPRSFWDMLCHDDLNFSVMEFPLDRWSYYQTIHKTLHSSENVSISKFSNMTYHAMYLNTSDIQTIDHNYFGLNISECLSMDPNQKLMLQIGKEASMRSSWGSVESIYSDIKVFKKTGIYIGYANSEWALANDQNIDLTSYTGSGSAPSLTAGRLAYHLDYHGPVLVIDTACSSSLVALNVAIDTLQLGLIDRALVGGVSLMLTPHPFQLLRRSGMIALDGKSRSFDANACGYGRGEGCGAVVLTTMELAHSLHLPILGMILSSSVNHDGQGASLTAPNGLAQQDVIQSALLKANLSPSQIDYIEAHGTGTILGDPIEIDALAASMCCSNRNKQLTITAIKSRIGHLEGAAGMPGLISAVLSVNANYLPSIINLNTINPHIKSVLRNNSIANQFMKFSHTQTDLISDVHLSKDSVFSDTVTYMGISSFSFSGTNSHVIISSPSMYTRPLPPHTFLHLFSSIDNQTKRDSPMSSSDYVNQLKDIPSIEVIESCSVPKKMIFLVPSRECDLFYNSLTNKTNLMFVLTRHINLLLHESTYFNFITFLCHRLQTHYLHQEMKEGIQYFLDLSTVAVNKHLNYRTVIETFILKIIHTPFVSDILWFILLASLVNLWKIHGIKPHTLIYLTNSNMMSAEEKHILYIIQSLINNKKDVVDPLWYHEFNEGSKNSLIEVSSQVIVTTPDKLPLLMTYKTTNELFTDRLLFWFGHPSSINCELFQSCQGIWLKVDNYFGLDNTINYQHLRHFFTTYAFDDILLFSPEYQFLWNLPQHPLLGHAASSFEKQSISTKVWEFEPTYTKRILRLNHQDHIVNNTSLVPVTVFIELFASAFSHFFFLNSENTFSYIVLEHFDLFFPLPIGDTDSFPTNMELHLSKTPHTPGETKGVLTNTGASTINETDTNPIRFNERILCECVGKKCVTKITEKEESYSLMKFPMILAPKHIPIQDLYKELNNIGFQYGDHYKTVQMLDICTQTYACHFLIKLSYFNHNMGLLFEPAILDGAIQAAAAIPLFNSNLPSQQMMPVSIEKVNILVPSTHFNKQQKLRQYDICYIGFAQMEDNFNGVLARVNIALYEVPYHLTLDKPLQDLLLSIIEINGQTPQIQLYNLLWQKPAPQNDNLSRAITRESSLLNSFWVEQFISYTPVLEFIDVTSMPESCHAVLLGDYCSRDIDPLSMALPQLNWEHMSDIQSVTNHDWSNSQLLIIVLFDRAAYDPMTPDHDYTTIWEAIQLSKLIISLTNETRHVGLCYISHNIIPTKSSIKLRETGIRGFFRAARLELEATLNLTVPLSIVDIQEEVGYVRLLVTAITDFISRTMLVITSTTTAKDRMSFAIEPEIAITRDGWMCTRISKGLAKPVSTNLEVQERIPLNTWVIAGGCGSLGQIICEWLITIGVKQIILLSTRHPDMIDLTIPLRTYRTHDMPSKISPYQDTPIIYIIQCDITNKDQVDKTFKHVLQDITIDIFIHTAGYLADMSIPLLTRDAFDTVWGPKVIGINHVLNIFEQKEKENLSLNKTFLIFFSSTASLIGNFGQVSYAAANGYLDSVAYTYGNVRPIISIQWGPWDTGMTKNVIDLQQRMGLNIITSNEGVNVLRTLIAEYYHLTLKSEVTTVSPNVHHVIGYQSINWNVINQAFVTLPPIYNNLDINHNVSRQTELMTVQENVILPKILTHSDAINLVNDAIMNSITRVLGHSDINYSEHKPLMELGLDSLGALEFRQILASQLGIRISATALFEHPTLYDIKNYLQKELSQKHNTSADTKTESHLAVPKPSFSSSTLDETNMGMLTFAVTGMACSFPESTSLQKFWNHLVNGYDCMSPMPKSRWDIDAFYNEDINTPGCMYVKEAGFINHVTEFSYKDFNITYTEAKLMDPQQRLFLEVGYKALLNANLVTSPPSNYHGVQFNGITGVFAGVCLPDWTYALNIENIEPLSGTGLVPSLVTNRFSYIFGLTGPSLSIDTACSASLVALNVGLDKLKNGVCKKAIIGGVQLNLSPFPFVAFCKARLLSPTNRCRVFDENADGYARGEGCGVIIVEAITAAELSEYQHHLHTDSKSKKLWGLIKGTSIGHDGRSANLIAPNGKSQRNVILEAFKEAKINLNQNNCIHYFESHGTGTSLGDAVELSTIHNLFSSKLFSKEHPLIMGAVKANIGHLEGAAGIAGFIKTILVLSFQMAPPIIHFKKLNPHIDTNTINTLLIPTIKTPILTRQVDDLIGCISSFGFGGALAHTVISLPQPFHISSTNLLWSPKKKLVLIFSGQGLSYINSYKHLFENCIEFRDGIERVATIVAPFLNGHNLIEIMYPNESNTIQNNAFYHLYAQPALFAIQIGFLFILNKHRIKPHVVIGHSLGEFAAAVAVGGLSLEVAARLVIERAKLMANPVTSVQAMLACKLSESEANDKLALFKELYNGDLTIAAVNSPNSIVLSGLKSSLNDFLLYTSPPITSVWLKADRAFHSPFMEQVATQFESVCEQYLKVNITQEKHDIEFISTVYGKLIQIDILQTAKYWSTHITECVHFYSALQCLQKTTLYAALELGSESVLTKLGIDSTRSLNVVWIEHSNWDTLDWLKLIIEPSDIQTEHEKENYHSLSTPLSFDERNLFPLPYFTPQLSQIQQNNSRNKSNNQFSLKNSLLLDPTLNNLRNQFGIIFKESTGVDWNTLPMDSYLSDTGVNSLNIFVFRDAVYRQCSIDIPIAFFLSQHLTKYKIEEFFINQYHLTKQDKDSNLLETISLNEKQTNNDSTPTLTIFKSPWLEKLPPTLIKCRLICFPYGGGSTDIFGAWRSLLPQTIEMVPVMFPGRSTRFNEDALDDVHTVAEEFVASVGSSLENIPFAFIGVSVGAIVAYEVTILLEKKGLPTPVHLFAICCAAPRVYQKATVHAAKIYGVINRWKFRRSKNKKEANGMKRTTIEKQPSYHSLLQSNKITSRITKKIRLRRRSSKHKPLGLKEVVRILQTEVRKNKKLNTSTSEISKETYEVTEEEKKQATDFIFDFLASANYRGLQQMKNNTNFATTWATIFSGDAAMALNYEGLSRPPIHCNISAIEGSYDAVSRITPHSMKLWREYTTEQYFYYLIPEGDHYLIHGKGPDTIKIILHALEMYLPLPKELLPSDTEKETNMMRHWYKRAAVKLIGHLFIK